MECTIAPPEDLEDRRAREIEVRRSQFGPERSEPHSKATRQLLSEVRGVGVGRRGRRRMRPFEVVR